MKPTKRTKKLSAVIDGVRINADLERPLPAGYRLREVLSDDEATDVLQRSGLAEFLQKGDSEAAKMVAQAEPTLWLQGMWKPRLFVAFVVTARRDVIKRFLFVFDHRETSLSLLEEKGEIIQAAVTSLLTRLNWQSAGEEGQAAIYENAVIEHLSPEELEKLADAQLTIKAEPRLKRELLDEILARPWEPEKPQELIALLKDGLHEHAGVPPDEVDEVILKIRWEDMERLKALAEQLQSAVNIEHDILCAGGGRLLAAMADARD